ncbi:MAG: hypothetical protein K0S08_753 [Gammaproteobacteria bacterium]|jgi:hypothetical protein|nr:hypothetical protein [Gammaproteobacteria bacterium]
MGNIVSAVKNLLSELKKEKKKHTFISSYRVLEILEDEEGCFTVHVQIIGKSLTFYAKPEEILADDSLVDQFSPRDIRTLTYLGYLGINAPKYKILARRLVDNNQVAFAIKKRGEKDVVIKTAKEILNEQDVISSMHPNDAKTIGYINAIENLENEKKEKAKLLRDATQKIQE